ncbi:MAG: 4Fe-4S ferredoxin [Verrucomicrobia bacterium]|jgi:coenzyme F420 hydrogenase subunit beta|nr:4Fe-4S ferredoxin [Verrucomicrobiota bacterium]
MRNVLDVQPCIGCGVCAAVCPRSCLEMRFDRHGEYRPVLASSCEPCGICLSACPFSDGPVDEDVLAESRFKAVPGIQHEDACGYVLSSHVGALADPDKRLARSSGGLASWFLAELLKRDIVDAVLCVENGDTDDPAFEYAVLDTPDAVLGSSKSCYYPVALSEVLRRVLSEDRRYAVVGLPCALKGIQKAALRSTAIRERMHVYVGLTCGHQKNRGFAEYLCSKKGEGDHAISFREKELGTPPYRFVFSCCHGKVREWASRAFERGWFKIDACNYCDDVFAECADVAFMDAWLPGYLEDSRGTSLLISRNALVTSLFDGAAPDLCVERIEVDEVIQSQAAVVMNKREKLRKRLGVRGGRDALHKRVSPCTCGWWEACSLKLNSVTLRISKELWVVCRRLPQGNRVFNLFMWHIPRFGRRCLRLAGRVVPGIRQVNGSRSIS